MPQLKIREMPQDERPREKLLARGPDALTNPELIAILLRTGRRGMNVIDVARELLEKMVEEVTGVKVLSLHQDISTVTGEEVVLFTLAKAPSRRETKGQR